MAVSEKFYSYTPVFLMNAVCDVAEMRKAKITYPSKGEMMMETEMYKIKKAYMFRLADADGGATLAIETDGDTEDARQSITLMFSILDGIINQAMESVVPTDELAKVN